MDEIKFSAPEYQKDQSLRTVQYRYTGSLDTGWKIEREDAAWLQLGPGYVPVKSLYCGICSTDLARHLLPFPLPQISGHEVAGEYHGEAVAIEINASHVARGIDEHDCEYCHSGQEIHCPDRMTLGIDRLPGGFSPWVLAPVHAIHPLPATLTPQAGVLIEPFAAAVKAVEISPPSAGDKVAVLGPRRLGMLIIAALDSHRKLYHQPFEIIAVMRHQALKNTALELGADKVILIQPDKYGDIKEKFDTVFDTTGSPAGFELAVAMAKQTVHLKSTHGKPVMGLENMTAMVINEQTITGFTEQKLFQLAAVSTGKSARKTAYVSPSLAKNDYSSRLGRACEVVSHIDDASLRQDPLPQFDFVIVNSIQELNQLTRPITPQGQSLLKATGTVLLGPVTSCPEKSELFDKISRDQLQLVTSRCGSFAKTIDILRQLPGLAEKMQKHLVTQTMDIAHLAEAMSLAGQSDKSVKVVVKTS